MKEMQLYAHPERIYEELRAAGIDEQAALRVSDLTAYDQYHYHGLEALDDAIEDLAITSESNVLDVGSGIGGPARYVADTTGCEVTALELQPDLHRLGADLTRRCGLAGRVQHQVGDVLDDELPGETFDALFSLLVFLHIPERRRLFRICRRSLKPGGRIRIEDFAKLREPSQQQWSDLRQKAQCPYLPTPDEYVKHLRAAGFTEIRVHDMSASWTEFTAARVRAFQATRARSVEIHGEEIIDGLDDFYAVVAELFASGTVGGVRISAAAGSRS